VRDLKKAAAAFFGVPWWQQQWVVIQEGDDAIILNDGAVLEVEEVSCIITAAPYYPLDQRTFDSLEISDRLRGHDPFVVAPDEGGKFSVGGSNLEGEFIDDAVVLQERLITVRKDAKVALQSRYTFATAAVCAAEVLFETSQPILVGYRVRYPSCAFSPAFGFTSRPLLVTENLWDDGCLAYLKIVPDATGTKVLYRANSFQIDMEVEMLPVKPIGRGRVVGIVNGNLSIYNIFTKKDVHGVDPRTVIGAWREVTCISSTATGEGEIVELPQSPMGWLEYDVFILFCSHSQEVRVSVG